MPTPTKIIGYRCRHTGLPGAQYLVICIDMWLEVLWLVPSRVVGVLVPEDGKGGPLVEGCQASEITSLYN